MRSDGSFRRSGDAAGDSSGAPASRRALRALAWALGVAAPVLLYAAMAYERRWLSDDGFINLRIAQNVLDGHGPVFNAGERVEAGTSPLWVALLVLLGRLGIRLELAAAFGGMTLAVAGLALGMTGAFALCDREGRAATPASRGRVLPLGAATLAVLPPAWDFASSGLESGLTLAWLGLSFLLLSRRLIEGRGVRLCAFVLGLGPLVRPDLALFSLLLLGLCGFAVAGERAGRLRRLLAVAAIAGAVPMAYQLFRMGYYGALVPNTALAKEALRPDWGQGVHYAVNFFGIYAVPIPLAVLTGPWWHAITRAREARARLEVGVRVLPVAAAALNALYIIHVGGDFMHGRLFVPVLFMALLPVLVVPLVAGADGKVALRRLAAILVLLLWLPLAGIAIRVGGDNMWGIGDERRWYVTGASVDHPVRIDDFREHEFYARAMTMSAAARGGSRMLLLGPFREGVLWPSPYLVPLSDDAVPDDVVLAAPARAIGIIGYRLGPRFHVIDRHGLADPIAGRLELGERSRPGHDKFLDDAWVVARFGQPEPTEDAAITTARRALSCGDLAELREVVSAPLTIDRFVTNLGAAFRLHGLRVPADPWEAEERFCGAAPSQDVEIVGGEGGRTFRWHCPDHHELTGLTVHRVSERGEIAGLRASCRPTGPTRPGVVTVAPFEGPPIGTMSAAQATLTCPPHAPVVALAGRFRPFLIDVVVRCADGTERALGPIPGRGEALTAACPPGQVAQGLAGRSGDRVDAIGLVCVNR